MITVTALLRRIVSAYAARISVIDEILCSIGDFAIDFIIEGVTESGQASSHSLDDRADPARVDDVE
jgi:hypothetical protein